MVGWYAVWPVQQIQGQASWVVGQGRSEDQEAGGGAPGRRCVLMARAERIIRIFGAELGLPKSADEMELLQKGDSRKVLCAALVKARTSVKKD